MNIFQNDPHVRSIEPGETLFERGDAGETMFVVIEGEVALTAGDVLLERLGPNGIFGEMALIDHQERSATAIAATPAKVVEIDQKRFLYLVQNTPFFAIDVMKVMAGRLRHMDDELQLR